MERHRYIINTKWKPPIFIILYNRPERFNKIKQLLVSIAPNVLSKTLKEMERDGLIEKSNRYHLTELGRSIAMHMTEIRTIMNTNFP